MIKESQMIDQGDILTGMKSESTFGCDMESGFSGNFSETAMKNEKASVTNQLGKLDQWT